MESNGTPHKEYSRQAPWALLLFIILYALAGMFIGQFFGVLLAMLLFKLGFSEVILLADNFKSAPEAKYILYSIQLCSSLGTFIAAPLLYLYHHENRPFSDFTNKKAQHIIPVALTIFITFSFMMFNTILIEWNSGIVVPEGMDALKKLEAVLRSMEERMNDLTQYLLNFNSAGDFLLAFIVVAVLPAIGEELLFRGLIQRQLYHITGKPHVAIWLAAFIFGAIHFQFYGLLPRMFLGAIFGYLYYWSGSLLLPMLAHFINNGFSLVMVYFYQLGMIKEDVTESSSLPIPYILVFLLLGGAGFWYFRRYFTSSSAQLYE